MILNKKNIIIFSFGLILIVISSLIVVKNYLNNNTEIKISKLSGLDIAQTKNKKINNGINKKEDKIIKAKIIKIGSSSKEIDAYIFEVLSPEPNVDNLDQITKKTIFRKIKISSSTILSKRIIEIDNQNNPQRSILMDMHFEDFEPGNVILVDYQKEEGNVISAVNKIILTKTMEKIDFPPLALSTSTDVQNINSRGESEKIEQKYFWGKIEKIDSKNKLIEYRNYIFNKITLESGLFKVKLSSDGKVFRADRPDNLDQSAEITFDEIKIGEDIYVIFDKNKDKEEDGVYIANKIIINK